MMAKGPSVRAGNARAAGFGPARRAQFAAVTAYLLALLYLFGVIVFLGVEIAALLHGTAPPQDTAAIRALFNNLVNPAMSAGLAICVVYMAHARRRR
ncbi:hypothetical protein SAMN05519104_6078 [Rhizobiales bacterium GAS188]|nr:hypothetical protein SAMN05519104_6078 [Rhizobiales bacterium GAS188]